jgi:ferrous iron transport protein A
MMPLGLLGNGEQGEIVEVGACAPECGGCRCKEERKPGDIRVEDMGLRVGKQVEMLNNSGSLVLLKVDETRIAINRSVAMKIKIRR